MASGVAPLVLGSILVWGTPLTWVGNGGTAGGGMIADEVSMGVAAWLGSVFTVGVPAATLVFAVSVLLVVVLTELVVCMVGFVVVTEFGFVVVLVDVLFAAVTQKLNDNN